MARCEECLHKSVCLHRANIQSDTYAYMGVNYDTEKREHYKPTAYVVPKSEVEELIRENESLAKTVNEASELIRKLRSKVKKSKSDVAREIFEEIDRMCIDTFGIFNHRVFTELKKKYTEGGTECQ